jgi:hypothetical protein
VGQMARIRAVVPSSSSKSIKDGRRGIDPAIRVQWGYAPRTECISYSWTVPHPWTFMRCIAYTCTSSSWWWLLPLSIRCCCSSTVIINFKSMMSLLSLTFWIFHHV